MHSTLPLANSKHWTRGTIQVKVQREVTLAKHFDSDGKAFSFAT